MSSDADEMNDGDDEALSEVYIDGDGPLAAARRLDSFIVHLSLSESMAKVQEPGAKIQLAVAALRADKTGRTTCFFDFEPFFNDLEEVLASLVPNGSAAEHLKLRQMSEERQAKKSAQAAMAKALEEK
jgi:hypothetical protein